MYITKISCKASTVLLFAALLFSSFLSAQVTIRGTVIDRASALPLPGATIAVGLDKVLTDSEGDFRIVLSFPEGTAKLLSISEANHQAQSLEVTVGKAGSIQEIGTISLLSGDNLTADLVQELLPTINVSDLGADDASGARTVSSLLGANRDPLVNAAAFNWGVARFNIRGYDPEYTDFYLNGLPFNDLESGRVFFAQWGGLNRVTNNRAADIGIAAAEYGFNGIGGGSTLDLRARNMRKESRVGYAISNRTYRNRLMGTYTTGLNEKGWALAISGSHRWAEEGYVEGTPYQASSYFLSVDKVINSRHAFSFTGLGAPAKRGGTFPSFQEMNDLVGTNYYNPNWGFQDGEKRNSRISNFHQPILMLRHDFTPSNNFSINTALGYQFGRGGTTAIDWFDAPDPRPDYYRKLPSFQNDPEAARTVAEQIRNNINIQQIDWDQLYLVNQNSLRTIEDVDGVPGNNVTGLRAKYVVEERRNDVDRQLANVNFRYNPTDLSTITGGISYVKQKTAYFKVLDDLLGADFYVDIDRFATFDSLATSSFAQNDLDRPNRLVREGDRFGNDYEIHTNDGEIWLQTNQQSNKVDYFFGGSIGYRNMWRNGLIRNGRFPTTSQGESERLNFFTYAFKYGATLKLDGRNFLIGNIMVQAMAPNTRDAFTSPRTRNQVVDDLKTRKIRSVEGGYQLRSPNLSVRVMGYLTQIRDQASVRTFFLDSGIGLDGGSGFVNYIINGQNSYSKGVEASVEVKLGAGFELRAVGAAGSHRYTNRPTGQALLDNDPNISAERQLFIKNFVVAGGPQTVGTLGLTYNSPQFWFVNVNFNYFDDMYLDFFPQRRTREAISLVAEPIYSQQVLDGESQLYSRIIDQEKLPSAYTLDLFGGKSFKIRKQFIYLNVGVNNILDKTDFVTGGFEQSRFDFEGLNVDRFPPRQFYAFGRNYFVSIDYRF